jgi:TonB family protein
MKRLLTMLLLFAAANTAPIHAFATLEAADPLVSHFSDSAAELKKGNYAKALRIDERLINEMLGSLGPGEEETKSFSLAVAHKALALAGLGREDDAIWYWHVAQNLDPSLGTSDMSMFGAPAEFLKKHPLSAELPSLPRVVSGVPPSDPNLRPPAATKRVEPMYPGQARLSGVSGNVFTESVIDRSGSVRDIWLLKAPSATLAYCAMEAVRQWKFRPATLDGQPVDVRFALVVRFNLH